MYPERETPAFPLSTEMSLMINRSLLPLVLATTLAGTSTALTSAEKDLAFNSYNNALYHANNGVGYYARDTSGATPGRDRFWQTCEEIEMAEDAYARTGNSGYRTMISELCNGLNRIVSGTDDWASWNGFNDDIMWGVIAFARAYEATGNPTFLSQAQIQFNAVWSRGWDANLGGGLWWNTARGQKNAAVNGPACIAALILARNTTNTGFKAQAKQIWDWTVSRLYLSAGSDNGRLLDHINADGSKDYGAFTYNQGTFTGASLLMRQAYNDTSYLGRGSTAAYWAKANLTGQHVAGLLNDEYDSQGGNGDGPGFKGVFARWTALYANGVNDGTLKSWLTTNANAAWGYRNSKGLMWAQWWRRTPDLPGATLTAWELSSGVVIAQTAP